MLFQETRDRATADADRGRDMFHVEHFTSSLKFKSDLWGLMRPGLYA